MPTKNIEASYEEKGNKGVRLINNLKELTND